MIKTRQTSVSAFRTFTIVLAFAGALTGCTSVSTYDALDYEQNYKKRHPILIAQDPEVLDIPIGMKARSLSPGMQRAVSQFVDGYMRTGTSAFNIQVPRGSANQAAAARFGQVLRQFALSAGVPPSHVRVSMYQLDAYGRVLPVRLSYLKAKATVPQCGLWPRDLGKPDTDRQFYNFGCASQQNLAAMVEDPGDFIHPRKITPADGEQRSAVIEAYRRDGGGTAASAPQNGFVLLNGQ